jgi:hypothetical protein
LSTVAICSAILASSAAILAARSSYSFLTLAASALALASLSFLILASSAATLAASSLANFSYAYFAIAAA